MRKKYLVTLAEHERTQLRAMLRKGQVSAGASRMPTSCCSLTKDTGMPKTRQDTHGCPRTWRTAQVAASNVI
jgi:hypothetical protein